MTYLMYDQLVKEDTFNSDVILFGSKGEKNCKCRREYERKRV